MTALDKAKQIVRTAKRKTGFRNKSQYDLGFGYGRHDAKDAWFGKSHRRKVNSHSYSDGYVVGWRSIKPGAKLRNYHNRWLRQLEIAS